MAIEFQYNKTSLQGLEKNLKMRVRALPTIKNKESALRFEVKRAKDEIILLEKDIEKQISTYNNMLVLWGEFDVNLLKVADVELSVKKIAGVKVPQLDKIVFETKSFNVFSSPKWVADGLVLLKDLAGIGIEQLVSARKLELLEHARKKTTQKVNLFEKVQIPGYEEAILKIKRFMEDEENLSKSSQKIVKSRNLLKSQEVES